MAVNPEKNARSIIVTGGASGIGRAAAVLLARSGCSVTIADMDEVAGVAVAAEINAAGARAQFVKTNVMNPDEVQALVNAAVASYGGLDGAINSAGIPQHGKPVHELTVEEWDRCNGVNLRGMFLCFKYQAAAMLESGGGAIVAVSSAAAIMGLIHSAEYCASKAGITGLVRGAAMDYAQRAIRVNAILPGATETPLALRSQQANPALAGKLTVPVGRMAQPEEIAASAIWLLSPEASYITGACINIDGGMTIA